MRLAQVPSGASKFVVDRSNSATIGSIRKKNSSGVVDLPYDVPMPITFNGAFDYLRTTYSF